MQTGKNDTADETDKLNATESRVKIIAFNFIVVIGVCTTMYFAILDIIHRDLKAILISLVTITSLVVFIILNATKPHLRNALNIGLIALSGMGFLILLATQYPDQTIALWCFPYPFIALLLLGSPKGLVAIILYNIGIFTVFLLDGHLWTDHYNEEYTLRYCAVMVVISIVSYYFESSRTRLLAHLRELNQSLERRIEERTKALLDNQERLRQAEKLESIGLLAGGIAHDFNNQLTGIMAFADLIRSSPHANEELRDHADNILASSQRSAELTSQLLAFARKGKILTVTTDIHRVIHDTITLIRHTFDKRITIAEQCTAVFPFITGDPTQLHSALLNLALNARDAMPEGGTITFYTDNVSLDETFCRSLPCDIVPGDYLRVTIADTGFGMDKSIKQRIFEPFFTTKEPGKGTGMGLPAVYGTIRSHNGAIIVTSAPGKGSVFTLYFPYLKNVDQAPVKKNGIVPDLGPKAGNVLLVDDEPIVCRSIENMLKKMGFSVVIRTNGKEAVDFYKDHWETVDLVIIDMVMPVMNGKEAFSAMKKINPDVFVLIASGYSLDSEAQGILYQGIKGYIQKPFIMEDLRRKISEIMPGKIPGGAAT
jgi:signal transduction histidine kinase